jgi:hypothetical protein
MGQCTTSPLWALVKLGPPRVLDCSHFSSTPTVLSSLLWVGPERELSQMFLVHSCLWTHPSQCGSWIVCISITLKLCKNAESWALPQIYGDRFCTLRKSWKNLEKYEWQWSTVLLSQINYIQHHIVTYFCDLTLLCVSLIS